MDQLDIIPVNVVPDAAVGGEQGVKGGAEVNVDFLGSHIFNLQQIVGDFRNKVSSLFCEHRRQITP